ncbi:4-phosphopantoate--beta-alanine ligase [Methanolobus mangrovi]|uniref:4-phosphopantoate--beta-alanine ligase n=1 Tax=Methanolobus mangrovi TaxID=3072977 RepID=A0AA51YFP7_9EURY|nr:4-phosphopantoate--beta-alanine ligase [Methanolobus mangrovi]WMW21107.1 4-phosphopantoate--beta-alanine ligase [Methanolobus mangrovi]
MTGITKDHPRYESLITREKIVEGVNMGITSKQGLVAQGRGEAFDYILGEKTIESAAIAERAAVAYILLAKNPIISVNGNTGALVPDQLVSLADITGARLEVNLFHRSDARVHKITEHLKAHGAGVVLGGKGDKRLDLSHDRAIVDEEGIFSADVVLVPLEDGDRCQKLVEMGKTVITIDLNPLSRTSLTSTVTIVDNVTRALNNMIQFTKDMKGGSKDSLQAVIDAYDNDRVISDALYSMQEHLKNKAEEKGITWI